MRDKKTLLLILIIVSLGVHFAYFGHPNETVFDEVHFGKFVNAYHTQEYYFDIHPPGGKLIIAGFAKPFDFKPDFSFAQIGQKFPDNKYLALRFLPVLAGALLPIVIYLLALELGFSGLAAFGAGIFVSLENALLTQSRYILLDPLLLVFGFSALLFYLRWRNQKNKWYLLWAGIFSGLAFSIKWTGLTFLGLIIILEMIHLWEDRRGTALRRLHAIVASLVIVPALIYFSFFAVHFSLLTKSGEGDAFMTPAFRRTLSGSAYSSDQSIKPLNLFEKFTELNMEMFRANKTLTASHPYGSKWYTWPLMIRPIYYWNASTKLGQVPLESKIYLIGNPFIWWASTVAILYLILNILPARMTWSGGHSGFKKSGQEYLVHDTSYLILVGGYALNLLPFIGIPRVMFLYHYFPSYIFAILALALLIDRQKDKKQIFAIMFLISAALFIYFAPLSYGLAVSPSYFKGLIWLPTWQ